MDAALASLAAQSRHEFKVFIGDDASPNDPSEVLRKYQDVLDIRYHRFSENLGSHSLVQQWNRCVRETDSQWVWLFADDDVAEPDCVESFFSTLERTEGRFSVYRFNIDLIDENDAIDFEPPRHPEIESASDFALAKASFERCSFAVEYIFRRSIFDEAAGFVEFPMGWCSDDASWILFSQDSGIRTMETGKVRWRKSAIHLSAPAPELVATKLEAYRSYLLWLTNRFTDPVFQEQIKSGLVRKLPEQLKHWGGRPPNILDGLRFWLFLVSFTGCPNLRLLATLLGLRRGESANKSHFDDRILRALSRTTASGRFIPAVDGLRFFAIAGVVLHHITYEYIVKSHRFGAIKLPAQWSVVLPQSNLLSVAYAGHFGVELCFVISGFILSLPYIKSYDFNSPKPNVWSYYLRRMFRLDPPYVLNLLISFGIIFLTNIGWRVFRPHLLASVFYLHWLIYDTASWINGVAWSLEVEVQFYLIVPILSRLFAIRPIWLRRTILIVLILFWSCFVAVRVEWMPRLYLSIVKFLQFFLAGFLLADVYSHHQKPMRSFAADLVAIATAALLFWILTVQTNLYWLTPMLTAVMCAAVVSGRISYRAITQRWIVAIGGMCYTIYLYHYLVISHLSPLTFKLISDTRPVGIDLLIQIAALTAAILLVSAAFYVGIEKPSMRLSRWIGERLGSGKAEV